MSLRSYLVLSTATVFFLAVAMTIGVILIKEGRQIVEKVQATPVCTHIVQEGESLSVLAEKYHVRVIDLQEWNFRSSRLGIGIGLELTVCPPPGWRRPP